jgi:tRNA threonylcarbamoyladenosine dehydratase
VAVVGLGGVGSWTAEALARCGVARLVLIDMDHVAESNINRQVQATTHTVGMAKGEALKQRIALIHPGCEVLLVDAFVEAGNWPALLPCTVDALVDACDQVQAKLALASWALATKSTLVVVGAAGGKSEPQRIDVADLAQVTHDPLLASLRRRLRQQTQGSLSGHAKPAPSTEPFGVSCVFSREAVMQPASGSEALDGSLNCHGYGSSVMVTAAFGMTAAAQVLRLSLVATPA